MADLTPTSMLTRLQAAEKLTAMGYPISKLTLQTMASRGGGPIYCVFGKYAIYRWADLLVWAEARCASTRRTSTSEPDGAGETLADPAARS